MKQKIKLGDKVRCKVTGFVGVAICRSEFLNGCIQYSVVPRVGKGNKIQEELGIDEQSLEVIPARKKKTVKKSTGGPITREFKRRNY